MNLLNLQLQLMTEAEQEIEAKPFKYITLKCMGGEYCGTGDLS